MRLITLLSVLMETEVDVTSQFRLNGSRMNRVELDEALHGKPKWAAFARKLEKAMTDEYRLDGVTVVLRELVGAAAGGPDPELLALNQKDQVFELAVDSTKHLPAACKIANKIDVCLNPNLNTSQTTSFNRL